MCLNLQKQKDNQFLRATFAVEEPDGDSDMEGTPGSPRPVAPEGEPIGPPGGSPLLDDFIAYLGTDDDPINYHVIVPGAKTMMSMKGYSLAPAFVEKGYQVDA